MTTKKRFNIKDELEKLYVEVPKALLYEPKYKPNKSTKTKGLSNDAKLLYGVLLDRTYLSMHTATEKGDTTYLDENGDIFIYFELAAIEEVLNVGTKKAIATKRELIAFDLLEEVKFGQGKDTRLYLNIVETNKDNLKLYTSSFLNRVKEKKKIEEVRISNLRKNKKSESIENTLYCQKGSTSTVKKEVQVLPKKQISNTKYSNTDFSELDSNVCMYVDAARKYFNDAIDAGYEYYINSIKDKIDFDLFERILVDSRAKNKTFNYVIGTINNSIESNITSLEAFLENRKNYKLAKKSSTTTKGSNKAPVVKTRFHNINESFRKYEPEELTKLIKESQKDKFKSSKNEEVIDVKTIREKAIDILQDKINNDDSILFKVNVRLDLDRYEKEINEICNELLNQ